MKKVWWIIGGLVVVIVVIIAAPYAYKALRGGDDAPAAAVSDEGAEAASSNLDGTWVVVPGSAPNATAVGYTVKEVLRGEPVTVVGSTDQVTGEAAITGTILESAQFEVQVTGISTDIGQRDDRARAPDILGADAHPTATLSVAAPVDLAAIPVDGTAATIPVAVDLTVKGATVRPSVEVTALRSGQELIASGAVPVTWADVGVEPPSLGFVTVAPSGTIDFLVSFQKR